MTPADLLDRIRKQLLAAVDPVYREGQQNYFKETIRSHGVRAPEIKRITAEAYRDWKMWSTADRDAFCESLWQNETVEEGGIAIYLCRRRAKYLGAREFRIFERWINRYVTNWAHCDGVSSWLLAACIANEPELMEALPQWTRSRNRWKRRAAAVALLQEAKQGRNTERIFEIAGLLLEDPDDLVQKGVGWLLKETYPKRPKEVMAFLLPRRALPSRTLLRYAAEKMSSEDRRHLLHSRLPDGTI